MTNVDGNRRKSGFDVRGQLFGTVDAPVLSARATEPERQIGEVAFQKTADVHIRRRLRPLRSLFPCPRSYAILRAMTSYKLVMPGDLNHYGFLFVGKMLMWVDEVAWMAVSGDYPGCNFVTVGMSEVTFHKSVHPDSVLRFETTRERVGRTSVTYRVEVFRRQMDARDETSVFTTDITFVRVGPDGEKTPIDPR